MKYEIFYGDFHGLGDRWCLRKGSSLIPLHSGIAPTTANKKLINIIADFHIPNIEQAEKRVEKMQPAELSTIYRGAVETLRADIAEALKNGLFN